MPQKSAHNKNFWLELAKANSAPIRTREGRKIIDDVIRQVKERGQQKVLKEGTDLGVLCSFAYPCLLVAVGLDKYEVRGRQIQSANCRIFGIIAINHPHIFHL